MRIQRVLAILAKVCFLVMATCWAGTAYAQVCTGSLGDPIEHITFGSGTAVHGAPLPAGVTNYTHTNDDFPTDGSYTIVSSTAAAGATWWSTTDHTGDAGGYMMVVNANISPTDYFYKKTITGLCPGATFEFAAWVVNLLRTRDDSPPNLTFTITSTVDGRILSTYSTGAIPLTLTGPVWKRFGTTFVMPAGESSVMLQISNNTVGARPGNDLAIDDITFSPCGPLITTTITGAGAPVAVQNLCAGDPEIDFVLNSAVTAGSYVNPVYQWQSNTGSGWVDIPLATSTSHSFKFNPALAGTYQYRLVSAEAAIGTGSVCRVASSIVTVNVAAKPVADFTYVYEDNGCLLRNIVKFKDMSTPNGPPITSWRWDFGDGEFDLTQNPTHTYKTYGNFKVTLTVSSNALCSATPFVRDVSTLPSMRPDFEFDTQNCPGVPVQFTDRSYSLYPVGKYILNFGDGKTQEYNDTDGWEHVYERSGTYPVKLSLISADGTCVSDVSVVKNVTVSAVDFSICQDDVTQFTDETDPTATKGFSYEWDFGDVNATLTNPNTSRLQNPTHRYTVPGIYTATLKVSSSGGCVDAVVSKTVEVRSIPIANFDIENKTTLCGADSVTFIDKTLASDNVNELVWYFDVVNQPAQSLTLPKNRMRSDKKYRYFYGVNNTTAPITYKAKLIARLGGPCADPSLDMDVIIYPTPQVTPLINGSTFIGPYAICAGSDVLSLSATANMTGTAVFTGVGVVNGDTFDPTVSGVGTFTITCSYGAVGTPCPGTTTFQIVVGSPVVSLPATIGVLEGRPVQIEPIITGVTNNLTFAWSPAAGVSDPTSRNPFFSPKQDTRYTLEVTSEGGCKTVATVLVTVLKTPVIPNAFTPNNDGVNDTWEIQYLDTYPGATVEVFNRNGARVYYSLEYPKPWDGTRNGAQLPVGVYYYVVNPRNGRAAMTGSITIVR